MILGPSLCAEVSCRARCPQLFLVGSDEVGYAHYSCRLISVIFDSLQWLRAKMALSDDRKPFRSHL